MQKEMIPAMPFMSRIVSLSGRLPTLNADLPLPPDLIIPHTYHSGQSEAYSMAA